MKDVTIKANLKHRKEEVELEEEWLRQVTFHRERMEDSLREQRAQNIDIHLVIQSEDKNAGREEKVIKYT